METQSDSLQLLRLPSDCSIAGIRNVHDMIRKSMMSPETLQIDCSGVDRADVTSVQLLISTTKTALLEGRSVNLTDLSTVLRSTIARAGVSESAIVHGGASPQNGGK